MGPAPAGDRGPGFPPRALLLTPVSPTAPLVALNLSLGDQAYLDQRDCGCPYQRTGWTTHLRDIESFEKLKAGGMTFLDTDVIRILEADLPARFGGGPTDYQLLEEDDAGGHPRVVLVVRPEVGPLDPGAVTAWFLERLGRGPGAEHLAAERHPRGRAPRAGDHRRRQGPSGAESRGAPGGGKWSGRADLNGRPPAPKAGALPGCATPRPAYLTTGLPTGPPASPKSCGHLADGPATPSQVRSIYVEDTLEELRASHRR